MQEIKKFYNKCSENSRCQIVFRTDIFKKLTLGAPDCYVPFFETLFWSGLKPSLIYFWRVFSLLLFVK